MKAEFHLEEYLARGVEGIVKSALRATLTNPAESMFMAKFAAASRRASRKRQSAKRHGEHIPPFLIASITSSCNLHCTGCYARANNSCSDDAHDRQLTDAEWRKIFLEAKELGISFVLLAGGEPMLRREVLAAAGDITDILFPVFTNGTLLDDAYMKMLKSHRNLLPVVSIEGMQDSTDSRRGAGVFRCAAKSMTLMQNAGIVFGASITVTTENLKEVTSDAFVKKLEDFGCKVLIYVEFVPVTDSMAHLAPGDCEREYQSARLGVMRAQWDKMVFIAFPGDEKSSGGCLAAGRGFFHISPSGRAEPCPFSPYSDINVKDCSLRGALNSKLFLDLREGDVLTMGHSGGCVLFEKKDQVETLLRDN